MKKALTSFGLCLFILTTSLPAAHAHHGWAWTTGGNIELTGTVETVSLGYPHGIITVKVNDDIWTVEVGQPWRNERAGLKEEQLAKGVEIKVIGEPSSDVDKKLLKAVRFYLEGVEYDLYPSR